MSLESIAETVKNLEMYPYFEMVEAIQVSKAVRNDDRKNIFSSRHLLSNYIAVMFNLFACNIIVQLLTAIPILEELKSGKALTIATVMWYLVNYSPFDFMFKACLTPPLSLLLLVFGEVQRVFKIYETVSQASMIFPGNNLIIIALAVLRGVGDSLQLLIIQLISGLWKPHSIQLMRSNIDIKSSLLAALIFVLYNHNCLNGSEAIVYMVVVFLVVGLKLLYRIWESDNFFKSLRTLKNSLIIGVWDVISGVLVARKYVYPREMYSATCGCSS